MDYQSSGVDIDAGNRAVQLIKDNVKKTYSKNVVNDLGSFAAGFRLDKSLYEDPILVSCTDGVGTKLRVAIDEGVFDTVGVDLVAMCVNDLICMGATPLFFLDYYACHKLDPEQAALIVKGMTDGCLQSGCALVGGEMAEMNDMYRPNDFDLAGFCVGVVDRKKVIDGRQIAPGQYVYGLPSSGVHSNGFSLVRKVLTPEVCKENSIDRASLLTPTKIYVNDVLSLIKENTITGVAHITGGGLQENIERILPDSVAITIEKSALPKRDIFHQIQQIGNVKDEEMFRVFNMGVGMVVISENKLQESVDCVLLGNVTEGKGDVRLV